MKAFSCGRAAAPDLRRSACGSVSSHSWACSFISQPFASQFSAIIQRYCSSESSGPSETSKTERRHVPKGYWRNVSNHWSFLTNLGKELGIQEYTDWYNVTHKQVKDKGGKGLFKYYSSLGEALKTLFPQHPWHLPRFGENAPVAPRGYWLREENLLNALEKAEEKLGLKEIDDWYSVNLSDLKEMGFPTTCSRRKLVKLLSLKYPSHKWNHAALLRGRYAQQKRLEKTIATVFPNVEILTNARKGANLINPATGDYLELDVYLPSLNLAFEYQDIHHYLSAEYAYLPLEDFQEKDSTKLRLAQEKGITLIIIPCWWDGSMESVVATINKHRPELVAHLKDSMTKNVEPIPEEIPPNYLQKYQRRLIEDIGEPTNACFLTKSNTDPTNWWIFEKYDGVRGFWNPLKKTFFSRHGTAFVLPQEIVDSMPTEIFLDGELWFGRSTFDEAMKISNRMELTEIDWKRFKYMVYDIPNMQSSYLERYTKLEEHFSKHSYPFMELASHTVCKDFGHLEAVFQDIVDKGGEGIILRDPVAPFKAGRSPAYLKHKKFRDAEAKILKQVGPQEWECLLPNGVTFTAGPGTSEFVKRWNPKPDDIISFKHRGFLMGSQKPKSPALYRCRPEMTWEFVIQNWKEHRPSFTAPPIIKKAVHLKPRGHWLQQANVKNFFEQFAKKQGFDPSLPENWNLVTQQQILALPGGGSILAAHGNLKKALAFAFPDVKFLRKYADASKGHWGNPTECRKFFDRYAADHGFNPSIPSNWYTLNREQLTAVPNGDSLLLYHGTVRAALHAAYPELVFDWKEGLKRQPTKHKPRRYWHDIQNRKKFFFELAATMGFDPVKPENWTLITQNQIVAKEGGMAILAIYKSLKRALIDTFPELEFKFKSRNPIRQFGR